MPNTPTVRTIALSLGVSRTAVSEALRGNACVCFPEYNGQALGVLMVSWLRENSWSLGP